MPPTTSKVWKFFKRCNDSKTVKCQLCEVELTYTGGTTNMLNHIRHKHSVKDESAPGIPDKQSSVFRGGKIIPINIQDSRFLRANI
jgi:hypothetical protein